MVLVKEDLWARGVPVAYMQLDVSLEVTPQSYNPSSTRFYTLHIPQSFFFIFRTGGTMGTSILET